MYAAGMFQDANVRPPRVKQQDIGRVLIEAIHNVPMKRNLGLES